MCLADRSAFRKRWSLSDMGNIVLCALGANLPGGGGEAPQNTLAEAIRTLSRQGFELGKVSRFWRTPAVPAGSGPDFINACCELRCRMQPADMLMKLHAIEALLGRERAARWGARVIDLDLLAVGATIIPDRQVLAHWIGLAPERQQVEAPGQLILPHPRLQDRGFVLLPLAEIAPLWRHPVTGLTVADMAAKLPADEKAVLYPLQEADPGF